MIFNKIVLPARPDNASAPVFNFATGNKFEVINDKNSAEIVLYDEIGYYGVTAKAFKQALDQISAPAITLKINSPGGDVFDGVAIFNDLKAHPAAITVEITGLAASAASIIAMAGDDVRIASNAFIMIHNAWTIAIGNKAAMRGVADVLEQIDTALAETYVSRTGIGKASIIKMMDEETWLVGAKAIELGFADSELNGSDAAAKNAAFDISVFSKAPVAMKKQIESALCEAGYSNTVSKAAVNKGFHLLSQCEADKAETLRAQREAAGDDKKLLDSIRQLTTAIQTAL
jgi:ATP-dependent Clp protease protease subunit